MFRLLKTYRLFLLWVAQSCIVLLLVCINPNHFTTIDSGYYLEAAQNLVDGNGYVVEENGLHKWNGTFPAGYSLGIALISALTSLSVLWSSKVLNLLMAGIWFRQLKIWNGEEKAFFTGCLLLTGPFLKLWVHTWSEPLFLIVLFFWVQAFFYKKLQFLPCLIGGLALLLVRYAGVFILPLCLGIFLHQLIRRDYYRSKITLILSLSWMICFAGYGYLNFYNSGEWFGGDRFGEREGFYKVLILFGKGLVNELLVFRDTNFKEADPLFLVITAIQVLLFYLLYQNRKGGLVFDHFQLTALAYLLFLFVARQLSPFDSPGYRLLSPFSFLLGWSLLNHLFKTNLNVQAQWIFAVIILLSWIHLLPQNDLVTKLQHISFFNPNIP